MVLTVKSPSGYGSVAERGLVTLGGLGILDGGGLPPPSGSFSLEEAALGLFISSLSLAAISSLIDLLF